MLIVEKFGGTSVAGPESVRRCAQIIAEGIRAGHAVAAVLSAQGDATDALLSEAARYSAAPSPRELDMLLSTGEQASVALMAMALEEMGVAAVSLTGWQAGVETDAVHGSARIRRLALGRVAEELGKGKAVLIAGFQGVSPEGDVTTLGRGGSDTTAVAVAAALRADECRIYTDVEGVYTADPRLVDTARKLERIDVGEMRTLSALGSKVLHERSVVLAERCRVPVEVLSSIVRAPGTRVLPLPAPEDGYRLTAVTRSGPLVSLVGSGLHRVPGLLSRAVDALRGEGVAVAAALERDGSLSVQVPEERSLQAMRVLHRQFLE